MKLIDDAKILMNSEEFRNGVYENFIENLIGAATGDVYSIAKAMHFISKSPNYIKECLFWEKFSIYLNEGVTSEEDKRKLSEKFATAEEKEEYARRIIKIIDDIDTRDKVKYLSNLTRALLNAQISKDEYYRLCNVLRNTLLEDLLYLKDNIHRKHLKYNMNIEFLQQNSLIHQTVIDGGAFCEDEPNMVDRNEYEFTNIAKMMYDYAINYDSQLNLMTTRDNDFSAPHTHIVDVPAVFS